MSSDEPSDPAWKHVKTHLSDMLTDLQRDYASMKIEIANQEQTMSEKLELISLMHSIQDQEITLNVGGKRFCTTALTLAQGEPESMLGAMFSGKYDVQYNDEGEIYIDREGKYFHYILEYLRDGYCLLPNDKQVQQKVAKEAEFYQLAGLLKLLRIQYRVHPPKAIDIADLQGTLTFYVWGSGGGNSNRSGRGGAGGFSWGTLNIQDVPAFDFRVVVGDFTQYGAGGISPTPTSSSYSNVQAGNGGGYSGIFSQDEVILIAGGGGGGGNGSSYHGGAGGGERGEDGTGPSTLRSGKAGGQAEVANDGESSYGGSIRGTPSGKLKGGDGALGSYDAGAGGGGGYFGGGGGGEGGGVDGPAGGGGSGYVSPLLTESGTAAGTRENCSPSAASNGYSNNAACVGKVKVVWNTDKGILEREFNEPGEYNLNPLSFQE
eukprot:TRINITY_DN255_c0_g1_i1.p1 TRINITY_DN255_c0_g1~~TRINITY_DN255_c0_g1_i1.p1  ORF type:complete len:448 (-),score=120.66 TRINITY_DN255_c0_g1_i1:41-1339(-)